MKPGQLGPKTGFVPPLKLASCPNKFCLRDIHMLNAFNLVETTYNFSTLLCNKQIMSQLMEDKTVILIIENAD